jgi:hypothetical protein
LLPAVQFTVVFGKSSSGFTGQNSNAKK